MLVDAAAHDDDDEPVVADADDDAGDGADSCFRRFASGMPEFGAHQGKQGGVRGASTGSPKPPGVIGGLSS